MLRLNYKMEELKQYLKNIKFEKRVRYICKKYKNKKIVIYGVGKLFNVIKENYDISALNIIGVSDIKFYNDNEEYLGYNTIAFQNIKKYNPDVILVGTLKYPSTVARFKYSDFVDTKIKIDSLLKIPFREVFEKFIEKLPKPKYIRDKEEFNNLKSIVNNYIDIRNLPKATGELRDIQIKSLEILKTIHEICIKNNFSYWLDSGTLLGAYRHKGYIPWDDDIDICMPRNDYEKILSLLKDHCKISDFYIRERAESCNYYQIRVINKFDSRIAVDIFPVDSYFKSDLNEKEKEDLDKKIKRARNIFAEKYPQRYVPKDTIENIKKDIINIQNKIVMNNQKPSDKNPALFYGIDFPYRPKKHLVLDYSTIFPLKTLEFEDLDLFVPNDTEKYLSNLYNNYMGFPSGVTYTQEEGFRQNIIKRPRK